jgi:hypothetical protein
MNLFSWLSAYTKPKQSFLPAVVRQPLLEAALATAIIVPSRSRRRLTLSAKEAEACIWATTIPRFTNQMWLEI